MSDLGVLCLAHTSGDAVQDSRNVAAARPTIRLGGTGATEGSFRINKSSPAALTRG